jgi:hypothetical protein
MACGADIVLVVQITLQISSTETAISQHLEQMGHSVRIVSNKANADTVAGAGCVVISERIYSGVLGPSLREVPMPVICMEPWGYQHMNMVTDSSHLYYAKTFNQTQVQIVGSDHYLAGDLSETVTVYDSLATINWGNPNDNAIKIAKNVASSEDSVFDQWSIFAFEKGTVMAYDYPAPARRVAHFIQDDCEGRITDEGWALFDASVNWCLGYDPVIRELKDISKKNNRYALVRNEHGRVRSTLEVQCVLFDLRGRYVNTLGANRPVPQETPYATVPYALGYTLEKSHIGRQRRMVLPVHP